MLLVPLSPSAFDMAATAALPRARGRGEGGARRAGCAVGLVAIRIDARTRSAGELDAFLGGYAFRWSAHLRDTQVYVHCARDGASVFDLPRSRAEQDWGEWRRR
ncbi:MAG: hypothetical protein MZW92_71610 [Comamonadaceae bacterium]|nr:hypothetical protein [Comamonadaceae bacterium]